MLNKCSRARITKNFEMNSHRLLDLFWYKLDDQLMGKPVKIQMCNMKMINWSRKYLSHLEVFLKRPIKKHINLIESFKAFSATQNFPSPLPLRIQARRGKSRKHIQCIMVRLTLAKSIFWKLGVLVWILWKLLLCIQV